MAYFPLLRLPNLRGWVDLHNFAPNDWEGSSSSTKLIHVTWLDSGLWQSRYLGGLKYGMSATITEEQIPSDCKNSNLIITSLSEVPLPAESKILPLPKVSATYSPTWRATLGVASDNCIVSYQGEVEAFPPNGSMLSFSPFIQKNNQTEIINYLVFLNLEELPETRDSYLNIFSSTGDENLGSHRVTNNSLNIIPIQSDISSDRLIILSCEGMSGIPIFVSHTPDRRFISIEHTHPPASLGIHGNRWGLQKSIKTKWFHKLNMQLK